MSIYLYVNILKSVNINIKDKRLSFLLLHFSCVSSMVGSQFIFSFIYFFKDVDYIKEYDSCWLILKENHCTLEAEDMWSIVVPTCYLKCKKSSVDITKKLMKDSIYYY